MAVHFHLLKVKAINKETADCVSVVFDVPEHLEKAYSYEQGQNITLKKTIDGEALRRSYSVCNAPHEKELKVAIKKVEGGKFSAFANDILQPGDELEVLPPTGKFNTALDASHKKKLPGFCGRQRYHTCYFTDQSHPAYRTGQQFYAGIWQPQQGFHHFF